MKNVILIATFSAVTMFAVLLSPHIAAKDGLKKIKSRNHSCEELRGIVETEQKVRLKGLGSVTIYADRNEACSAERKCRLGTAICESFQTNWRTSDKRFCTVGFSCMLTPDNSR